MSCIYLFSSFPLELAGHSIGKADCSKEGPLLFEERGHPSEQTFHQDSFRVKMQTPHTEVVSGTVFFGEFLCFWFSFVQGSLPLF